MANEVHITNITIQPIAASDHHTLNLLYNEPGRIDPDFKLEDRLLPIHLNKMLLKPEYRQALEQRVADEMGDISLGYCLVTYTLNDGTKDIRCPGMLATTFKQGGREILGPFAAHIATPLLVYGGGVRCKKI